MSTEMFTLPTDIFAQVATSFTAIDYSAHPDVVLADENTDPDDFIVEGINFTKTAERMLEAKEDLPDMPTLTRTYSDTSSVAPTTPAQEVETVALRDLEIVPSAVTTQNIPDIAFDLEAKSTTACPPLNPETDSFYYPMATFDPILTPFPEFSAPAPVAVPQLPSYMAAPPQPMVSPYDIALYYQQLIAMSQLAYAAQAQYHLPCAPRTAGPARTSSKAKRARATPYVLSRPIIPTEAVRLGQASARSMASLVTGWQPEPSESPKPKPTSRGRRTERPFLPMHLCPKGMPLPGIPPASMQAVERRADNIGAPL